MEIFQLQKAGRLEHVRENSGGAEDWKLTEDDLAAIDRAFPAPHRDKPLEMI
jgi:diketogulonate reductase-like aldo/keto reductase